MTLAEGEARRLGFTAITLYTNARMSENIRLYERLGYTETGRKTEQGYDRVYMQKSLFEESG